MGCYALLSGKHLPTFQRTAHLQGKTFQKITHLGLPDPEDDGPNILHLQFSMLWLRPITSFKKRGNLKLGYFTSLYSVHAMWNYVHEKSSCELFWTQINSILKARIIQCCFSQCADFFFYLLGSIPLCCINIIL